MKNIVILTGAGISAESGLKTFRDRDGLWEGHRIEDVATPEAWERDQDKVLDFYNQRRKAVLEASPNAAHLDLCKLEQKYNVYVVTQNVDDLHERAGSKNILHLHGEIKFARSTKNPNLVYPIDGWELSRGMKCELGSQLRPHIVWFGEAVPAMDEAIKIVEKADMMLIVGTSLAVYPAAGLVNYLAEGSKIFVIDPACPTLPSDNIEYFKEKATTGVSKVVEKLL